MIDREDMLRSRANIIPDKRDEDDLEAQWPPLNDKSALKSIDKRSIVRQKLLSFHHTWTLIPLSSKVVSVIFISFLIIHIVLGTLDVFFHYYGLGDENKAPTKDASHAKTFAVVINTYKRPQMLREAVTHYADRCGAKFGVAQVFIVWAEQTTKPPDVSALFLRDTPNNNRANVNILQVTKDSLNSRFEPIPQLQSDAMFMVDDDVRVSCPSLFTGFQAWLQYPQSMVSYYPRLASAPRSGKEGELVYHGWPTVFLKQSFNFVLTKASFLHRRYLDVYFDKNRHPPEILEYVDAHMNCEDVAMSMLVANYTRSENGIPAYPIHVEGSVGDKGLFGGISTGSGHMATRSQCLTDLSRIYEKHGWRAPLSYQTSLKQQSWVHHYPGFWWQYRPSNFFEWFALGNLLS